MPTFRMRVAKGAEFKSVQLKAPSKDGAIGEANRRGYCVDRIEEIAADETSNTIDEHEAPEPPHAEAGRRREWAQSKFCPACGVNLHPQAELCPTCGVRQPGSPRSRDEGPSRIAACLFAVFLGWTGAHKFYLGRSGIGVAYLLVSLLGAPLFLIGPIVISLISFVEGLMYLSHSDSEFAAKYG